MQKIMLAVSHKELEDFIRNRLRNKYLFCLEDLVYLEEIYTSVKKENPDILLLREDIRGTIDILSLLHKIKKNFPEVRIIFLSTQRSPGDAFLSALVSIGIYDINHQGALQTSDIINLIEYPRTFKDVSYLQPVPIYDKDRDSILFEAPESQIREVIKVVEKEGYEMEQPQKNQYENFENEGSETFKNNKSSKFSIPDMSKLKEKMLKNSLPPNFEEESLKTTDGNFQEALEVDNYEDEDEDEEYFTVPEAAKDKINQYHKKENASNTQSNDKKTNDETEFFNKNKNEKKKEKTLLEKPLIIKNEKINVKMANGKRIISFISGRDGVGTSTIAFGCACALAGAGEKILFIDLNGSCPSIGYYYELQKISNGLETFMNAIKRNDRDLMSKSVIKGIDIKNGKSGYEGVFKKHSKFPENLDFLCYSSSYILSSKEKILLNREAIFYLMAQAGYSTIIIDCHGELKKTDVLDSLIYSTSIFPIINSDVISLGYLYSFLDNYEGLLEKSNFIYNMKGKSKFGFTDKEARKWIEKDILTIPFYDAIDALYYQADIPFVKIKGFRQDILKILKKM